MKRLLPRLFLAMLLILRIPSGLVFGQPSHQSGVMFFKGSWNAALAEAKRQNKPIFLDVYTTWCPPCKRMDREAFPNPRIGASYNVHFINYRLDAELREGHEIAKRYAVASYPTALFIASDGRLIHRAVGYGGVNAMLAQVDHVLSMSPFKGTIAKGDRDYAKGRHEPAFLKKYIATRQLLNRPVNDVLDAYIDALTETERTSHEIVAFIAESLQSSDTRAFSYLLLYRSSHTHADRADEHLNAVVSDALDRAITNDFEQASLTNDAILLEKVIVNSNRKSTTDMPAIARTDAERQAAANNYRLRFYRQTKNVSYQALADSLSHQ
ncbi:thioredoxin family protein [Spirosoma sp. SC4-14]|uniref:thioredoxin family protein n=1 Tax=Spirosoma sp. SC4-14 TaxID=3128900 RepID=UPI0030D3C7BC